MNIIFVIGNLTKDPTIRQTRDGKTVCNFSVAVNKSRRAAESGEPAIFYRVAAWGALGENCARYLSKGKQVAVVGSPTPKEYMDGNNVKRYETEIYASDVQFLSPSDRSQKPAEQPKEEFVKVDEADPDLPF